jgi:uncharacterized protein (DUF362 family)
VRQLGGYARGSPAPPFRPGTRYAELDKVEPAASPNPTYEAVRALLRLWAGDDDAAEPFGGVIQPGMRVTIKPNLVLHQHPAGEDALRATVTDGAVLRVILDYVAQALHGDGTIVIAESPVRFTDFRRVVEFVGLDLVLDDVASTWNVNVELIDIRDQAAANPADFARTLRVRALPGDPRGGVVVDLGRCSAMEELGDRMGRLRSTAAVGENETRNQHQSGKHVYELSRSVLDADAIISVPKLKTHKKAGMTGAMKNFVGAVIRKEWLPHHRRGAPSVGGDEFADDVDPRLKLREHAKDLRLQTRFGNWLVRPGIWMYQHTIKGTPIDFLKVRKQSPMVNGGWSGNDTCWRMVHDLFRAVLYARPDGSLADRPVRVPLTIVDGLIAGEGDGPLRPHERNAGILAMGYDAPWVDYYLSLMMGFDPSRIPMVDVAIRRDIAMPLTEFSRADIELVSDSADLSAGLRAGQPAADPFIPPAGWARHFFDERMYELALRQQMGAVADY